MASAFAPERTNFCSDSLSTKALFLLCFSIYVVIVFMQWVHFAGYYGQPKDLSLIWSVVDWAVWALIFAGYVLISNRFKKVSSLVFACLFVLLSGPLQLHLANTFYAVVLGSDETLWQAFIHMMNKRWLTNIYVATLLLAAKHLLMYRLSLAKQSNTAKDKEADNRQTSSPSMVTLDNGGQPVNIHIDAVSHIVSCRNYISLFVKGEELVVRNTLKSVREYFPSDAFIQVSRSSIVNKHYVLQMEKYSNASYRAIMSDGSVVNIGRTYKDKADVQALLHIRPNQDTVVPLDLSKVS